MSPSKSLSVITLYLSGLGLALSGYLSYQTLFVSTGCTQALITCGGTPVRILGVPQCVLGFVMFLAVAVISLIWLTAERPRVWPTTLIGLGIAGSLFAGGLSIYELWIRTPAPTTMPSCVYGFFLYLGILLAALLGQRSSQLMPSQVS